MATTIYYGTNRVIESETPLRFGDPYNADKPYYYRIGEVPVEKVAESWQAPDRAYRCGQPVLYDEAKATETEAAKLGSETLFHRLRGVMIEDPRDALVFLHGFASSFQSAMERAAELHDQYLSPRTDPESGGLAARARHPLVFAFSWPSDGRIAGWAEGAVGDERERWAYASDREDARASGLAIARCAMRMFAYLARLRAEERCLQRVHLVAHSMGNWALRHALQEMVQLSRESGQPLRMLFDNVFLMAADIEDDALEKDEWLKPLFRVARRVHVYHADNDTALSISDSKPGQGARLGHLGPANMAALSDRVSAIDCSGVSWTPDIGHARHQYYRMAPEVVQDVRDVLAGKPPDAMRGRVRVSAGRWRLKTDLKARERLREG